jgi:hypothetical protein
MDNSPSQFEASFDFNFGFTCGILQPLLPGITSAPLEQLHLFGSFDGILSL